MKVWGKIICGALGLLLSGGHIVGLLIGLWIGHRFDKGLSNIAGNGGFTGARADAASVQKLFFESTFRVMGHLAKADGVVTPKEIAAAEAVMARLGITGERRKAAIEAFNFGKQPHFDLSNQLNQFLSCCARQPALLQMFLEIQLMAAQADGQVSAPELNILYQIAAQFGLSKRQLDMLLHMTSAQESFYEQAQGTHKSAPTLQQAYDVLGVSEDSSWPSIKRAYRKLMAEHHPDKLLARGLPEEMIQVATEKSQEIQAAYELIKKHHRNR